ncbi:MAG TPA: Ig-like domain-containing protein [Candidatus Nanoarchaeia archaeon]
MSAKTILNFAKFHQEKLTLGLVTVSFAFCAVVILYSLLPPKIHLSGFSTNYELDQPLTAKVLGLTAANSVEVKINPSSEVILKKAKGFNPFLQTVSLVPNDLLQPETTYEVEVVAKNWFGVRSVKNLSFKTASLPKVLSANTSPFKEVSPKAIIIFEVDKSLSGGNFTLTSIPQFEHKLKTVENKVVVTPTDSLEQGGDYQVSLNFGSKTLGSETIYETKFSVIDPLEIISSSPTNGATTVAKQSPLIFNFNKALKKETLARSFTTDPQITGTLLWKDDQSLEFSPSAPLATATTYAVTFSESLEAADGSILNVPAVISFTTAGVVKVLSISPSGGYASLNSSITVDFDQPVDQPSTQAAFSVSPPLNGSFSWRANTLILKPNNLALSTTYQVKIAAGIKSIGGEDSTQDFSANFTTTGERVKTIGKSIQGRLITAYYFGTGQKKILLVGTMHGSESNTGSMLSQWVSYLRSNQNQIPSDRTFVIIPYANPDGRASNNRFNANGVDLNRNWGTTDWQALTYWQTNSYPSGGGSGPFSEPETQSLRDLIVSENPSITITYHSAANLVIGDGAANNFGDWYANLTGYSRSVSTGEEEAGCTSALGYCITGTMEEWMSLRGNIVIVVEFISATSSEYSRNLPALKGLLTYLL